MEEKNKGGRPSKKTPEVVDEILDRLSRGQPLSKICSDDHMPSFMTVFRWEKDDPEFRELSTYAREVGTHYLAGECLTIADQGLLDPQDRRIRIDTRLRLIGKWNAKSYGEKVEQNVNHSGTVTLAPGRLPDALGFLDRNGDPRAEGHNAVAG